MEVLLADSRVMYCPPCESSVPGILKIDTNTDTVAELDDNLRLERGNEMWFLRTLTLDGCIYLMPSFARRIIKLDQNNCDTVSSVGAGLGSGARKYRGTAVGIGRSVYGMPYNSKRIV